MYILSLENIIIFEYLILILLTIFTSVFTIIFEIKFRKKTSLHNKTSYLFSTLLSQQVLGESHFIPKDLRHFETMIRVLLEYNLTLQGNFWDSFKRWIIYDILYSQFLDHLYSKKWHKQILAIQAMNLSPNQNYSSFAYQFLKSEKVLLQLAIVDYAIHVEDQQLIYRCIQFMCQTKVKVINFFLLDEFLNSSETIYRIVYDIYEKTENAHEKIQCIKILAEKTYLLNFANLKKDLESKDFTLKWWACRALANYPSREATEYMKGIFNDPDWRISFLSIFYFSHFKIDEILPILQKAIEHPHFWVKICAGWALKQFGEKGKVVLLNLPQANQFIATYVLSSEIPPFEKKSEKYVSFNLPS